MTRTKNALRFVFSSALVQLVIVISGLILPPLMIKEYGSEVNGIVNTIKQLVTYFSVVSLGLGITSQVALYAPLNENNWPRINAILSATQYFFRKTGLFFLALILITAILMPLLSETDTEAYIIFLLVIIYGVGAISEFIIISKYKTLLVADQKQNVISNIQSQGIIINTVVSLILILFHFSIVIVLLVATLSYLLRLLLTINYVKKRYKNLNFNVEPDFKALDGKWQAFSYQISNMINNYTPIILVAFFCGFNDASVFSIYNMIFFSVTMITGVFSAGFSASFGNLIVDNHNSLLKSFLTYEFVYRNVMFIAYTIALIMMVPFMSIYISNDDGVNYVLPFISMAFVIQGVSKGIRVPFVTLVEAAGLFDDNKKQNIIEAILNVIISIFLVKLYGMIGVLIGGIFSAFLRSILYIVFTQKKILNLKDLKYYIKIIINALLLLGMYLVFDGVIVNSITDFIILGLKVSISVVTIFVLLNSLLDYLVFKDFFNRFKYILLKK